MSQPTPNTQIHQREVTVLQSTNTTYPQNITISIPNANHSTNSLITTTVQQAIINNTLQPSHTMIHPSRLALITNTASSSNHEKNAPKSDKLLSFDELIKSKSDFNHGGIKVTVEQMEKHKLNEIQSVGLANLCKIDDYLFLKTKKHYVKLYPLLYQISETKDNNVRKTQIKEEVQNILSILRGCNNYKMLWKKQLLKYKSLTDALKEFNHNLGTETFQEILSGLLPAIIEPNIKESEKKKKEHKKKKKKEETKPILIRKFEELEAFTGYGIIKKPLLKKRKLGHTEKHDGTNDSMDCCDVILDDMKEDVEMVKNERKSVSNWNWYSIIYWLNRVKNGRFNNMNFLMLRKHIFIGRIRGYQLNKINHITLNMIGISDYNLHQMILNAIAELLMNDDFENEMMDRFNVDIDIPQKYLDPISYEVMKEPVINQKSGKCYERECIKQYREQYNMDPFTKKKVKSKDIKANTLLKVEIDEWTKANFIKRTD